MKKIIYSLVIMIAAGSLFTSCVTNTEPQGIKDIRQAKADYIESLSNLKKAEAEKVKAEAAYQDALTAYQNAQTALVEADVKAKEIRNSVLDAKAQAEIEKTLADAELAAVEAAKKLALAEFELQKTLGDIAVWSEELTPAEQIAIKIYTDAYNDFIAAEQAVRAAEAKVYYSDLKYAEAVQELRIDTAIQSGIIEANVMALNNLPDSGASASEIQAFFKKFDQEKTEAEYALANIDAEWNYYRQTEVAENIKGFATELSEWVVKNAALPAPYAVHFKTELPDNDQVNKLLAGYLHNENIVVDPKNKAIAANFYSIPSAEDGLEDLNTVVSALNRDLVVDSTKYYGRVDTTGMSVALANVWDEYDDVLAALKAGVEAYEPVVDAKAALEAAEEDLEAAEEDLEAAEDAYVADKEDLKDAIKKFVDVWNVIAEDGQKMDKNDTTDLFKAFKNLIDVRAAVLPYEGPKEYFKYISGKENDGADKVDSVKFTELTQDMLAWDNDKVKAFGGLTSLESAINQVFNDKTNYLMGHFYQTEGYLTDIDYNDLYGATTYFSTLFYGEYYAGDVTISEIYVAGKLEPTKYEPKALADAKEAVTEAEEAVAAAKEAVTDAYKAYYTEVYGKFWGIEPELATTDLKVSLKNPDDSLVVNFTKETFTKEYPIVSFFTWTGQQFYNAKDSTFDVPSYLFIQGDEELAIVMTQLKANQGWPEDFHLHKLLLTEALWCQYAADTYSIGAEGTTKALARLTEISDELFVEIIAALAKQVEDSKPFFEFVENLIGKECIDGIFARIDSAATVAAEFEPATTEPGDSWLKMIAKGEITSKELFILKFEEFICGKDFDDEGSAYRTAYEHMQIAKAFTGEEFADLVSDVIAAFIDASEINLTGKGNIIEKILFGTVEKVNWSEISGGFFHKSLVIVAPVVGPYIAGSFGGKIAELQDKYFTEWKEKWAEYDVARAIVNAKLEQLATEAGVVIEYANDIKGLLLRAKIYERNIEVAIEQYTKDCETLAAIEAGADWRSLLKEKIEDELAKAIVALEAAKVKLDAAYEAYKQVLANHNLAQ